MARERVVKIPQEIYGEINLQQDELSQWVSENKSDIVLDESVVRTKLLKVLTDGYAVDFSRITDEDLEKLGRDPFLIAYALSDRDNRVVVTSEVSKPSRLGVNRHIPDVCEDLGLNCIEPIQFIEELNFSTDWDDPNNFELLPDNL